MLKLKLIKTELDDEVKQRVIRIQLDAHLLRHLTLAEIKMVYSEIEAARDALSRVLDRADGK